MDEINIELKDGYEAVKAIYYKHGLESIFTYRGTKLLVRSTILLAILSVIFYLVSLIFSGMGWIALMAICSILTIIVSVFSIIYIIKYLKRKKAIDKYLDQIRKQGSEWLTLTKHHIKMSNRESTSIEKWAEITYVSIQKDYITLKSDNPSSYIFPEKSMGPHQFALMIEFIKQRMESDSFKIDQDSGT